MKTVSKFNAALALGSLTAAVALLSGAPAALAQADDSASGQATAAGGGSFPGSFLVPGTNTSIKIGGFAKLSLIYDWSAPPNNGIAGTRPPDAPDVTDYQSLPLPGSLTSSLHNAFIEHARQSNVNFDTRTPTSWGEVDTFILIDFFGRENVQVSQSSFQNGSNPDTARMVYAYGTLGPLLAGQAQSLWYDADALGETVDPTPTIGTMNGSTNRQPQIRYTYALPSGISAALSIENPEAEGTLNSNSTSLTGTNNNSGTPSIFNTSTLGGIDRVPDIVARVRMDQSWGHVAATGLYRDMQVVAPNVPRVSAQGYGIELSGHYNTFGKDTVRAVAQWGRGLGHYMTDYINIGGLQVSCPNAAFIFPNCATGAAAGGPGQALVSLPTIFGGNVSYTHWWSGQLRSTVNAGYTTMNSDGIMSQPNTRSVLDRHHMNALGNLVWSPVPQVDLGIEYEWGLRQVIQSSATLYDRAYLNRGELEAVFKF